ncbi:MAG: ASKHA domain-containing protein [Planctomycetota bacterium]
MPRVTFEPSGKSVVVTAGIDLLTAARRAGVEIEAECGGKGTCGTCAVRVVSGEVDASDGQGPLSREDVATGHVLACKSRGHDTPVTVECLSESAGAVKTSDTIQGLSLIDPKRLPGSHDLSPLVSSVQLEVPPGELAGGCSDLDRFTACLKAATESGCVEVPLPVLRRLAVVLRERDGRVTAIVTRESTRVRVLACMAGHVDTPLYGAAIDIGTTTVAVLLVSLAEGGTVSVHSGYNRQVSCGLDVISRINYARREGGLKELRERVLETSNELISHACAGANIPRDQVVAATVSGNTTMIHLLLGLNPEYIRLEPYTPTVLSVPGTRADEIGLDLNPSAAIRYAPCVGSYVGGDITAGVLCTDLVRDTEEICLFIDIGTNGELVLGNRDFLIACACSAGPSFEGGGIECGRRAAEGAIERVAVNPDVGTCTVEVIGNTAPRGICGSGMISLLAGLLDAGWLDQAGKLKRGADCPAISVEGRRAYYTVVPAERSGTGRPLVISETDIENIVRSKAAIYSACSLMLNQVGVTFDDIARIYIAGGFGRFIDVGKAIRIGLLPDVARERFHFIGNASLAGTYMTLVSRKHRELQEETTGRMTYLELNTDPSYMDEYTAALFLPHTKSELFPSV